MASQRQPRVFKAEKSLAPGNHAVIGLGWPPHEHAWNALLSPASPLKRWLQSPSLALITIVQPQVPETCFHPPSQWDSGLEAGNPYVPATLSRLTLVGLLFFYYINNKASLRRDGGIHSHQGQGSLGSSSMILKYTPYIFTTVAVHPPLADVLF